MNLDGLKDQIKEKWNEFQSQLEESPTYDSLKEKYMGLSSLHQRLVIFVIIGGFVLLISLLPLSYMISSGGLVGSYEERKKIVQSLFVYSSVNKSDASLPQGQNISRLISIFSSSLNGFQLLPKQIGGVSKISGDEFGKKLSFKPPIIQAYFQVELKLLNIQQVIQIGSKFQGLASNVKMLGLDLKEDGELADYYNVIYKFVGLSLPEEPKEDLNDKKKGSKKRKNSRGKRRSKSK